MKGINTALNKALAHMKNHSRIIEEANGLIKNNANGFSQIVKKVAKDAPKNFEKIACAQANYNKPFVKVK